MVGESGCGKSTFGRVLLQLYQQTEGEVIYYGKSVKDMCPEYRRKIYQKLPNDVKKLRKLRKKSKPIRMLEVRELEQMLAEMIGGLLCAEDIDIVSKRLIEQYENWERQHRLREKLKSLKMKKVEHVQQSNQIAKLDTYSEQNVEQCQQQQQMERQRAQHQEQQLGKNQKHRRVKQLEEQWEKLKRDEVILTKQLDEMKQTCQGKPDYIRYEEEYEQGIHLERLTERELRSLRKDLQLVFQDPYSSLNPRMTVGQLIGEGVRTHKIVEKQKVMEHYVKQIMEDCGLASYMIHRYPHQFSGGQRQRIGIARSLALHPRFIVCDEAVSALDVSIQAQIINLLMELKKKEHLTYLFISHDLSVIRYVSDRVGVMYLGRLVELSGCKELFENPFHPYTRALLSTIPSVDSEIRQVIGLSGELPNPMNPPKGCTFHTRCQYCTEICTKEEPTWEEFNEGHCVACHHAEKLMRDREETKVMSDALITASGTYYKSN